MTKMPDKNEGIAISCGKSNNDAYSDNDVDNAFDKERRSW